MISAMGSIFEDSFDISISIKNSSSSSSGEVGSPRNGYPFKRFHSESQNGRGANAVAELGLKGNRGNQHHHHHMMLKSQSCKSEGFCRKRSIWFWIYSLLVCFVIACFMAEALIRDTIMVFVNSNESTPSDTEKYNGYGDFINLQISTQQYPEYFGEDVKFKPPLKLESHGPSVGSSLRHPIRQPHLALACPDLSRTPQLLLFFSIATALQAVGYKIELFSLQDGAMRTVWEKSGISVRILLSDVNQTTAVDWLNFDGVVVSSLESKNVVTSLMQEPFKEVPLIWIVHEGTLGLRLSNYSDGILTNWKDVFHRPDLVIFHDYSMPMIYSVLDTGNFHVVPGTPSETWEAEKYMLSHKMDEIRLKFHLDARDFVIVVVGSPFIYKGRWLEHMLVMRSIQPIMMESKHVKLFIVGGNINAYDVTLQKIAGKLGFPHQKVQHVPDVSKNDILFISDLVLYGSLREEQGFPRILERAMSFGKPVIMPNLTVIQNHIDDGVHAFIYPSGNVNMMTKAVLHAMDNGRLSLQALKIASAGKLLARNIFASEAVFGYAAILENVIQFPSEAALPFPAKEIPEGAKREWQWQIFEEPSVMDAESSTRYAVKKSVVLEMEEKWNQQTVEVGPPAGNKMDETIGLVEWVERRRIDMTEEKERQEKDQLDERTNLFPVTWEDVYRSVKKAERGKSELHERDDGEIERTGQPLCIYEPYSGPGAWPFLHENALYRGIGLTTKSQRATADDIDASSRLPLLQSIYYRNALCEYGALFAIASRVDRIHKNAWIGFHSWRETARKASLSKVAEKELIDAISRAKHGSAVYFWARMDKDVRGTEGTISHQQDFWSFCDAINAGMCRSVFSGSFKSMYHLPEGWNLLPPMPANGGFWSVSHSWAMPTSSFLEFVMFARMFVDSLDAQHYEEHFNNGTCRLSASKTQSKHCYCRMLELLVNVWAYHSGRRLVYVDPETGVMQEQHKLETRRGHMWSKWFNFATLKAMDEDLAEEADSDATAKRWLWPNTGEVYWQGIFERERNHRNRVKKIKQIRSRQKLERMRGRHRQKSLGKYIRPQQSQQTQNQTQTAVL